MKVNQFILDNSQQLLTIVFANNEKTIEEQLSFEYLRISSPEQSSAKPNADLSLISHKKGVLLVNIESVAKHGYRFIFSDNHTAVYSEDYLETIALNFETLWQQYLSALKVSGHSRETMINFKQV